VSSDTVKNKVGKTKRSLVAQVPWPLLLSEFIGTALLLGVGLSIVIFDFGHGSPMLRWIPSNSVRRALTGFLFGSVGGSIALSSIGKRSGAHINPVVTLAFRLRGTISTPLAAGYILAQLSGAVLGSVPLLLWGPVGKSVAFGATLPSVKYGSLNAALGEVGTTFVLVVALFSVLGVERIRKFTPLLFPPLYGIMVWLEAPLSGTSTNPARSLGPAVVSGDWHGFWVYIVGPFVGCIIALTVLRISPLRRLEVDIAKIEHFSRDEYGVLGLHHLEREHHKDESEVSKTRSLEPRRENDKPRK
jgi:aquaporin Z